MLTQFDTLSDQSRIWIYQADRTLTSEEQHEMMEAAGIFLTQWAAHGQDLSASATIKHDQFLIIATDESFNMASGCSIDSSVHFVQDIGNKFNIDFFDRMKLAFLVDNEVRIVPLNEIKSLIAEGSIGTDTLFFQNTIGSKGELRDKWRVKAGESWLKRYFNVPESV